MIAHYNTEYRYYSFRGAYFPLRICLLVPHQKLYQFLQRNIYSTGTIAISTREYMIAVLKYPHCKIKFLCSHSCDILFQRIPLVNPLGLNSRQGPTRRMGGGIWYVYQDPARHNTNISKGSSDCSTPPQLFMMFHTLNKTTPDNIEISQITNWTT